MVWKPCVCKHWDFKQMQEVSSETWILILNRHLKHFKGVYIICVIRISFLRIFFLEIKSCNNNSATLWLIWRVCLLYEWWLSRLFLTLFFEYKYSMTEYLCESFNFQHLVNCYIANMICIYNGHHVFMTNFHRSVHLF